MNDNFYLNDLMDSLEKDIVMERYYPLIAHKGELTAILNRDGVVRKDQVSDAVIEDIRIKLGEAVSGLFARFIHIYDFHESKLREIKDYVGRKEYNDLSDLLRLPGVRLLRAKLYFNSGVTLEALAEKSTEDIRDMVRDYVQREKRSESIPKPKEVNCHREVAKMILHTETGQNKKIKEMMLSNRYDVRKLTTDDIDSIYELCCGNPLFYEYHPPFVTRDSIAEDMKALPPGKTMEDKYFIGFFSDKSLIAVMDLILGYPKEDIAFIGFFMTDKNVQSKGVGSDMISECISYLKKSGISKVRLGVDKGNPQSLHFWTKNHFVMDESYHGEYIVMERVL